MGSGPLREPRLLEIESKLNAGRFDEAQRLLATIGNFPNAEVVSSYFATRLLFQRGRLDHAGVIERLRELLLRMPDFPEAARMLAAAEAGVLDPAPEVFRRVTGAPLSSSPSAPEVMALSSRRAPTQQEIPRAPLVPRFTPRTGIPSYAPETPLPPHSLPVIPSTRRTLPGVSPTAIERERMPTLSAPAGGLPLIPSLEVPRINSASTLPPPEPEQAHPQPANERAERPERPSAERRARRPHSGGYSVRPHGASLFEIAAALDAGHPARALELTEQAGSETGPELTLLTARALAALGQNERATAELERLLKAPLLEPLLRAGAARVLIEAGHPESALVQARRALSEDPDDPINRVTCAWALVRMLRRSGDVAYQREAEPLLASTRLREGAVTALLLGLRAALAAPRDPMRAVNLAQSALQQDPRQVDALAALSLAQARLGQHAEMERTQQLLAQASTDEAQVNEAALARYGFHLSSRVRANHKAAPAASALWGEVEAALVGGHPEPALKRLQETAHECLRGAARRGGTESWQAIARSSAEKMTELPVFRHFAPYDCSVFSVARLDAVLSLLFAEGQPPPDDAVIQMLGAYVGESWRQAYGAEWQGIPAFPFSASIEGIGLSTRPCERIKLRLTNVEPLVVETPHSLHPGADPFGNSVPLSLAPPAPWDPSSFPSQEQLSELARHLDASVIGLYCERALGLPLDRTLSGMVAIDCYAALLAPPQAPPDATAAWALRAALILGAYLGEVLVSTAGARWTTAPVPSSAEAYRLELPHGATATPIVRVLDRLSGRRVTALAEYTTRLASGRASVSA